MPKIEINKKYTDVLNNLHTCVASTKQETVNNIKRLLPELKCGFGGSHVWVSLQNNERIAIIYFY